MKYPVHIYVYIYIYISRYFIYLYIHICTGYQEFIHVFYWCIPLDHEIYTKCKKTSNLIKDISSHNICSGIKTSKKKHFSFSAKNLIFPRISLFYFSKSLLTIQFHECF